MALCAGQVITEMEEADAIADIPLLCRIVTAHEAVYEALECLAPGLSQKLRPVRANVPRTLAALVKELMPLGHANKRRALIARCVPILATLAHARPSSVPIIACGLTPNPSPLTPPRPLAPHCGALTSTV